MDNLTNCPLCHSNNIAKHWEAVNVWRCSLCGLLFRNPLPSQEELAVLNEQSWSDPHQNLNATGGTDIDLARTYAAKLTKSLALKDIRGAKILEFGAGKGEMLAALTELDAEVYGIDPFGYDYLKKQGFDVFRTLGDIPKGMLFDGIIAIDVIEHLPSPWDEIRQLSKLLENDGFIYLSTLNSCGLNARIYRSKWREVQKPVHTIFYSSRSIEKILANYGFGRYQRLRWFITYSNNPIRKYFHFLLQALSIDGELRYLAWK